MNAPPSRLERLPWPLLACGLALLYGFGALGEYAATPLGQVPLLDVRETLELARAIATGNLPPEPFYRAPLYAALLGLVAGTGASDVALLEIARVLRQPFILVAVAAHHHQRVLEVNRMVGAEAELAAGLQLRRDQVERPVVHHPPLRVARLGPGIGVEQIGEG